VRCKVVLISSGRDLGKARRLSRQRRPALQGVKGSVRSRSVPERLDGCLQLPLAVYARSSRSRLALSVDERRNPFSRPVRLSVQGCHVDVGGRSPRPCAGAWPAPERARSLSHRPRLRSCPTGPTGGPRAAGARSRRTSLNRAGPRRRSFNHEANSRFMMGAEFTSRARDMGSVNRRGAGPLSPSA